MKSEQFINICKNYNINISNQEYNKLYDYYKYLVTENEKYNLTTIIDENDVFLKHFLDSMMSVNLIDNNLKVLDIGCGAGFPSVPLKILRNDLKFTLVDSVNKKVNFVNTLCDKILQLSDIEAVHARCEDLAKMPKYRENFDIIISRAVASLNSLLEYAIPFLKVGGKCIFYKSRQVSEEINQSSNAFKILNCKVIKVVNIDFKEIESDRCLVIIEKFAQTPMQYPRLQNKVRKNPL